jgi:ornithine carbamoyltransferase
LKFISKFGLIPCQLAAWVSSVTLIHYGYEIDEYAARGPKSLMFDQAENRMWSQMALMIKLLKK